MGRGAEVRQTGRWRYYRTQNYGLSEVTDDQSQAVYASAEIEVLTEEDLATFIIGASTKGGFIALSESENAGTDKHFGAIGLRHSVVSESQPPESLLGEPLEEALSHYTAVLPKSLKKQLASGKRRILVISTHGERSGELTGIGQLENVAEFAKEMVAQYDKLVPPVLKDSVTIPLIDACHAGGTCRALASEFPQGVVVPKNEGTISDYEMREAERGGGVFFEHVKTKR